MNVDVIIEIPKNTNIKYEYDYKHNKLRVDRIVNIPFVYPGHYGYIPNTLAEDGDCLDAVVLSDCFFLPGCIINTKVIGVLSMEDEQGIDHKIICVPNEKVEKKSKAINGLSDIDSNYLKQIEYFFAHYKDLEENKWSKIFGWNDINEASKIIKKSIMENNV